VSRDQRFLSKRTTARERQPEKSFASGFNRGRGYDSFQQRKRAIGTGAPRLPHSSVAPEQTAWIHARFYIRVLVAFASLDLNTS
jgi:hypothetical protein